MDFIAQLVGPAKRISTHASRLLAISSLFVLANGLSNVFVTVYLWKLTSSFVQVAIYNISVYTFMLGGFILSGYLTRKKGLAFCLRMGMVSLIIYFALILKLNTQSVKYIYLLGWFYGIGSGLFYYSTNTLLYYYTSLENRGFYLGVSNSLASVMNIISPTIAGYMIVSGKEFSGYYAVFYVTFLLYITAGIISYFLDKRIQVGKFDLRKVLFHKNANWKYVLRSNFFLGVREGAIYFIIDILYFITFRNELSFGGFTTMISFIGVISAFLIGKYIHYRSNNKAILIGGSVTLLATIMLVSYTSETTVIGYGILTSVFNYFWLIPVLMIHYQVAQSIIKSEESMGDYMIAREVPTAIGRVLGILLFIAIEMSPLKEISVRVSLPILNAMILVAYFLTLSKIKNVDSGTSA
jgi:YQGE family putative transporter